MKIHTLSIFFYHFFAKYTYTLPHISLRNTCIENTYSCGPLNDLGQSTVVQCINGNYVFIDNCDGAYTQCTYIDNIPYCVQAQSNTALYNTTTLSNTTLQCTNENTYSCGPLNDIGQSTVVQCINGNYVFIDNCDGVYTQCIYIDNIPYCV